MNDNRPMTATEVQHRMDEWRARLDAEGAHEADRLWRDLRRRGTIVVKLGGMRFRVWSGPPWVRLLPPSRWQRFKAWVRRALRRR